MEEKNLPEDIILRKKALVPPADGKTVAVKGCDIFYRELGQGPVLLYIHGNLGCHRWFDDVMDLSGFRTVAPDMPNFGYSGRIDSCEIETYGEYMAAFLDALAIERAVIVGHSLGGAVAQAIAVNHREKVEKMVLIDSGSPVGLHTPEESYPIIEQYKTDYQLLSQALSHIMPGLADGPRKTGLVDSSLLMSHHCYLGHAKTLDNFDVSKSAETIDIPVLVMRGAGDILITEEMARETAEIWKGKFHVFPQAGHSPLVEMPGDFISVLEGFLN